MNSKRHVGFLAISWLLVWVSGPRQGTKARKPTHGTYLVVRRPATAILPGLHRPHLPHLRRHRRRLGPLSAAPLHHRSHLLQPPRRPRAVVPVPSLLQPCRLGPRHPLAVPG